MKNDINNVFLILMHANGFALGEGGDIEVQMFMLAQMFNRIPKLEFNTKAPLLPNACYRAFFCPSLYYSGSLSAYKMSFGKRSFCKYFMSAFDQKWKFISPIVPLSNQFPSLS